MLALALFAPKAVKNSNYQKIQDGEVSVLPARLWLMCEC